MRYAATIIYVPDVAVAIEFYEKAFGLKRGFVGSDFSYGTLTGDGDGLSFAAKHMAPDTERAGDEPAGFEIWIESDDVPAAFAAALDAGAKPISEPEVRPWGQTTAYVRDPSGNVVEIGEPVDD